MGKSFKDLKIGDYVYVVEASCARKERIINAGISKDNKVWMETDYIRKTDCGEQNNYYHNIKGDDNKLTAYCEYHPELVFSDKDVVEKYIQDYFVERIKD